MLFFLQTPLLNIIFVKCSLIFRLHCHILASFQNKWYMYLVKHSSNIKYILSIYYIRRIIKRPFLGIEIDFQHSFLSEVDFSLDRLLL